MPLRENGEVRYADKKALISSILERYGKVRCIPGEKLFEEEGTAGSSRNAASSNTLIRSCLLRFLCTAVFFPICSVILSHAASSSSIQSSSRFSFSFFIAIPFQAFLHEHPASLQPFFHRIGRGSEHSGHFLHPVSFIIMQINDFPVFFRQ